jgi:predicted rRNA methylase YqxC with S4 and FtsJ domains
VILIWRATQKIALNEERRNYESVTLNFRCKNRRLFILALIKPQFEAGKGMVEKGGLIRDEALQKKIVGDLAAFFSDAGLSVCGTFESPIKGAKGNREFFIHLRYANNAEDY